MTWSSWKQEKFSYINFFTYWNFRDALWSNNRKSYLGFDSLLLEGGYESVIFEPCTLQRMQYTSWYATADISRMEKQPDQTMRHPELRVEPAERKFVPDDTKQQSRGLASRLIRSWYPPVTAATTENSNISFYRKLWLINALTTGKQASSRLEGM